MTETFFGKRHIHHPRTIVLLTGVSKRKLEKLRKWLDSHDHVEIWPSYSSREIFLVNETKRPK